MADLRLPTVLDTESSVHYEIWKTERHKDGTVLYDGPENRHGRQTQWNRSLGMVQHFARDMEKAENARNQESRLVYQRDRTVEYYVVVSRTTVTRAGDLAAAGTEDWD